jgi:hypothetical protein
MAKFNSPNDLLKAQETIWNLLKSDNILSTALHFYLEKNITDLIAALIYTQCNFFFELNSQLHSSLLKCVLVSLSGKLQSRMLSFPWAKRDFIYPLSKAGIPAINREDK